MLRWSARLRRAASLLLGVHLLQVILLAASAICERGAIAGTQHAAAPVAAALPPALDSHHAHHEHGAGESAVSAAVVSAPADAAAPASTQDPTPTHHHAPASGGACPMAMACTVTAVAAHVPTIDTQVVLVSANDVPHLVQAPTALHYAPEPPPPRA